MKPAPSEVTLRFSQEIVPAFSHVKVLDQDGRQVDRNDGRVDSDDPKAMHVSLEPLRPGTYRVTWRVVSMETHVTKGDFTFRVLR